MSNPEENEPEKEKDQTPKPVKEKKYICKTKCYHKGRVYKQGDIETFEHKPPKHFKPVK